MPDLFGTESVGNTEKNSANAGGAYLEVSMANFSSDHPWQEPLRTRNTDCLNEPLEKVISMSTVINASAGFAIERGASHRESVSCF